jgi:hypothetical protein
MHGPQGPHALQHGTFVAAPEPNRTDGDLKVPIRDERAPRPQPDGTRKSGVAAPVRRFAVIVGEGAGDGSAWRIEAPGRLLRLQSLLEATYEQIDRAALPPEGMPKLQRQLQAIRRELENTVSPALAAELRRILPPGTRHPARARCGSSARHS